MNPHRNRQFRELAAFLTGMINDGACTTLRIFEIGDIATGHHVNIHVFGGELAPNPRTDMAVCVYNGPMRLLIPTCVTSQGDWLDWRFNANKICEYSWVVWKDALAQDETLATAHTLEPCIICGVKVRVPTHNCFAPIGAVESDNTAGKALWGEWNPWICQAPTNPTMQSMPFHHQGGNPLGYKGLAHLSVEGKRVLGIDFMPASDHWWRLDGPLPDESMKYFEDAAFTFTSNILGGSARKGDSPITSLDGLYPKLCALQEKGLRDMGPKLQFACSYADIIPEQLPWIKSTLTVGVDAIYEGGIPVNPRTRGLPYQMSGRQHCITIGGKMWNDVLAGRMFARTAKTVDLFSPVEATPTTMVDKKNPGRAISTDKRVIADLRRANLSIRTSSTMRRPRR